MFAGDYAKGGKNIIMHIYMRPVGVVESIDSSVSTSYNKCIISRIANVGEETGTGKLDINFVGEYTGNIKAKIIAR